MQIRKLAVEGAFEFTPEVHPDERGIFLSPFQEPGFLAATGGVPFSLAQSNHVRSRRGVVRGIHYTATPPGSAKYVYCARGRALDLMIDIRLGSPTFGQWDSCLLDQEDFRAVYLPIGMGHAVVALEEDTVTSYLISQSYVPELELSVSPLDPALGLPIPDDIVPLLSRRDTEAPTLAEAERAGILPRYADCLSLQAAAGRSGRAPA
ncbi:MAG TPA: dTDP-4-dehydrorhamnose 3,5-epimerase [Pilimelia sp.]|nr:dTDP-4-dehydrorhamnose 3,5-epimerase [Pilimelia sp.]